LARTIPTMAQAVPGNFVTAALWNANVQALGNFVLAPPLFLAYASLPGASGGQSIPHNAFAAVLFDTEVIDTEGGHSTTTNSQRYTFQVPGVYRIDGTATFTNNGTGFRAVKFELNTTGATNGIAATERTAVAYSGFATSVSTSTILRVNAGDYVSLNAYQNSGAALTLDTDSAGEYASNMMIQWLSQ